MKELTTISKIYSLALGFLILLVSNVHCSPHRFRRSAADSISSSTEAMMASSSSPFSSMTSMMPSSSSHDGHQVNCDGDTIELKNSCPNNDMCPSDTAKLEKCCHCLNTCCDNESSMTPSSSSEESSMNDSTMRPEDGSNKNFTTKMKDAVHSAEGWLKNQGQKIQNQWDKAKESIKNTASDVKDKVKKGYDTARSRFRNTTAYAQSECKDGKCSSTDSTIGGSTSEESTESVNNGATTTATPGMAKSKRDLYGVARPTYYETRNPYFGGRRDSSDSDEFSWSRMTTTTTGNGNNRRYKRENSLSMNNTSVDNGTMIKNNSSDSKTGKSKREADSSGSSQEDCTSESGMRGKRSRSSDLSSDSSSSSTLPSVKTSKPATVTEGSVMEDGKNNGGNSRSGNRNIRDTKAVNKNGNKEENSTVSSTSTSESSTGGGSSSKAGESNASEEEDDDSYYSSRGKGKSGSKSKQPDQDNGNVEISVHVLGPNSNKGGNGKHKKNSESGESGDEEDYDGRHTYYSVHSPSGSYIKLGNSEEESDSDENNREDGGLEKMPPLLIYPDGSYGGVLERPLQQQQQPYHHYHHHPQQIHQHHHHQDYDQDNNNFTSHSQMGHSGQYTRERESQERRLMNNDSSIEMVDIARFAMMKANEEGSKLIDSPSSPSAFWRHDNQDRKDSYHSSGNDHQMSHSMMMVMNDATKQYQYAPIATNDSPSLPAVGTINVNASSKINDKTINVTNVGGPGSSIVALPSTESSPNVTTTTGNGSSTSIVVSDASSPPTSVIFATETHCPPLRPGVDCVTLKVGIVQCTFDDDCTGAKKCCFHECDVNKRLGICYDPIP